jgi:predicted acyltransferase
MNRPDFTQRNTAIDILRALTMLLMIFVNDFWTVKGIPHWMHHAKTNEDFLGLADVVFPLFLFVVGMSIPYAIERRFSKGSSELSTVLHILTRTFALLIMGIFTVNTEYGLSRDIGMSRDVFRVLMIAAFLMIWNVYPKTEKPIRYLYVALQVLGVLILIYLAFIFRDAKGGILQIRWWGILGLIGWTYLVCSSIYLFVRDKIPRIFFFWLGFVILCMVKSSHLIPRESFFNGLLNVVNIGSGAHVVFTMGGILFSLVIVKYSGVAVRKKVISIVSAVAILLIAATIANNFWIISKNQGTLTWVLYCSAAAIGLYGLIQWAVSGGIGSWFNIIKPAGTATLTCYLVPYLLYSISWGFLGFSLPDWMKEGVFGLIKCAVFAFLCIGVTALLERFKIKIKI